MIEVEVKLKINSVDDVLKQLVLLGFIQKSYVQEEDKYFENEDHFVRNSDSALRVRTVKNLDTGDEFSQVNFKGKRMDSVSMSRPEYETEVKDGKAIEKILNQLGFFVVEPTVSKVRKELILNNLTACLDQVCGLGDFLELEILVEKEEEKSEALECIENLILKLEASVTERTNVSYLSQLQQI